MRWSQRSSSGRSQVSAQSGAWLMTIAKRRAIDSLRRTERLARKHEQLGRELETAIADSDLAALADGAIEDDLLRLIFVACHPLLSRKRASRSRCDCWAG